MDQDETWHAGIGLDPRHTVLDGDPSPPPPKGHSSQFSAHICCGQMAGWIKMPLGMDFPKRGRSPPIFGPCLLWPNGWMDQDVIWYGGGPQSRPHCARWRPSSPLQKGGRAPDFRSIFVVAKRLYVSGYHLVRR